MSQFKKSTAKTVAAHLRAMAAWADEDKDVAKHVAVEFNTWCDELLGQDFFGTEGQCDPRGDHRD